MEKIEYGTEIIEFEVKYSSRKTLGINIYPDATVQVIAPLNASMDSIKQKVLKRAFWIKQQQRYFNEIKQSLPIYEYVSGETHKYLGRSYRLKVSQGDKNEVKLIGRFFLIESKSKDSKQVKKLLDKWYRDHATKKVQERLDLCYQQMKREGISYPTLELRKMAKRWGSCTPEGKIIINPRLIKAPVYCIDYVLIHELCHLKHHNHSPAFYHLKSKYMPDWERRKKKLEMV